VSGGDLVFKEATVSKKRDSACLIHIIGTEILMQIIDASESPLCHVIPVLATGIFDSKLVDETLEKLGKTGSIAAPGFARPEGIVIFHSQNSALYKVTFDYDVEGKGQNR